MRRETPFRSTAAAPRVRTLLLAWLFALTTSLPTLHAVEVVKFQQEATGEEIQAGGERPIRVVTGRVLESDAAGSVYLQEDDGKVWMIKANEVISRESNDQPFVPVTADVLGERLLAELPPGFKIYQTPHYVVAHRTSRDFAKWTASMLERLYRAFTSYWSRQGIELHEPEFPLVVLVYPDAESYAQASADELGGAAGSIVGYYNFATNRVSMYDLSGLERLRSPGQRGSFKQISRMLASPAATPLVTTVVHEATHQIAFNCGLQTRYAELPLWLIEGMAVYFEAPDLSSGRGWRGIGKVNYPRLEVFRHNLPNWKAGTLASLVATSKRMRDPRTAGDAYADAWALNYFLIKHRSKQYTAYVKALSKKRALVVQTPDERLAEFREHFGDLDKLQRELLAKMSRVR